MTNSKTCTGFTTPVARRILLLGTLLLAAAASAETNSEQLRERLQLLIPGHTPDQIRLSPSPGLYEVLYGADIFYITGDGKHLITDGNLIDVDSRINLTEISRAEIRVRLLNAYGTDKMLVFRRPCRAATRSSWSRISIAHTARDSMSISRSSTTPESKSAICCTRGPARGARAIGSRSVFGVPMIPWMR